MFSFTARHQLICLDVDLEWSVALEKLSIFAQAVVVGTTGIPVVLASLDHVVAALTRFVTDLTQPVGGKVTASNLSVNGNAWPTGAEITVKVEDKLLFNEFPSTPAFGAETVAENVCDAFVKPAYVFKVKTVDVPDANDPDQFNV